MAADTGPAVDLRRTDRRRAAVVALARALLATAAVLVAYFLLPLERLGDISPLVTLPVALVGFVALVAVQVRAIWGSDQPGLRALEALAASIPLFLVIFAATYYVLGQVDPTWFSESMSKLDALYFTVTVFATVGFGDITATSPPARVAVTIQMAADLLVIGLGLRVILGAVQEARRRSGRPVAGDG